MTITRQALRRKIAHRTQQPFFRQFGVNEGTATGGSTTTIVDTALLVHPDDFWNGDIAYNVTKDYQRVIDDFVQSTKTVSWLAAATAAVSGDKYEIWSQFTPVEVHTAIDAALADAWPFFFGAGREDIVVQSDRGTRYTLPTATNTIKILLRVYLKIVSSETGTLTEQMPTTTTIVDANATFASDDVGKKVAIYASDTAALGQVRTVASVTNPTTLVVSAAFSAQGANGDKYRLLDDNAEVPEYTLLQAWRVDKEDNPAELWIGSHPSGYEGHRLEIHYEYEHPALSTETAATSCPQEFVILAAMAKLYQMQVANAPATEVANWEAQSRSLAQAAAQYSQLHQQSHGSGTLVEFDQGVGIPSDYPFR
jgi:hypothetical protein